MNSDFDLKNFFYITAFGLPDEVLAAPIATGISNFCKKNLTYLLYRNITYMNFTLQIG